MSTGNQPGRIACPHCGAMIRAPALAAGSQVNCPKCGQGFRLGQETVVRMTNDQTDPRSAAGAVTKQNQNPKSGHPQQRVIQNSSRPPMPQTPPPPGEQGKRGRGKGTG